MYEELIKQIFVDFQESQRRKDTSLILPHIDENIYWLGARELHSKEQLIDFLNRGFKLKRYPWKNATYSDMRIFFESKTTARVLLDYSDIVVQHRSGSPALFVFWLRKVNNDREKWLIYKKIYVPTG